MRTTMAISVLVSLALAATAIAQDPPAQRGQAYRMGEEGVVPPVLIKQVLPEMTPGATRAGTEGSVYISAIVTVDGEVVEPELVRGLPSDELNRRALEAVSKWKFKPGTKDGAPVPVVALFTVTFRVHEEDEMLLGTSEGEFAVGIGDRVLITGCETDDPVVPGVTVWERYLASNVNLWDRPGGEAVGAQVVAKRTGDSREDPGLRCQEAVVILDEVQTVSGQGFAKVTSVLNGRTGWVAELLLGQRFDTSKCEEWFEGHPDAIKRCHPGN